MISVSKNGDGNFASIQDAIGSVSADRAVPVYIFIHSGVYNEKLFIQRSHITLIGENWDSTRIVSPVLREEWVKDHGGSDWGAGVVNIDTGISDISLMNLTVWNNHGSLYGTYKKHQFAVRGAGTRIILYHCKIISDGGDALSLWNRDDGMYYHADCYFEGWVDYVCPRGWCYVTNSSFFGHNTPSASIWHDGSRDKRQKFVITNSRFDGVAGFPLGRNHLDGQFYLIDCRFSDSMADRPFYRPPSSPHEWQWGDRHYFFNCHRDGGDYPWFADNLGRADGSPKPDEITAMWTFDGNWDPEASLREVCPMATQPVPYPGTAGMDPGHGVISWTKGNGATMHEVYFGTPDSLAFKGTFAEPSFDAGKLSAGTTYAWRVDEVTPLGVVVGELWRFSTR